MGHIEPARVPSIPAEPTWIEALVDDARDWSRGRWWIPRALLLVYLVYAELRFFRDPLSGTIFSGITLAFHEMGHLLFAFAGHFIGSLMGSGTQVLVPIIVILLFVRQPDYFGVSVGGFWLSFSLFELANYVGDARSMELPLVGFSSDPEHDWHYLLGAMHMLPMDHVFAFLLRVVATLSGAASLAVAIWLFLQMARPRPLPKPAQPPRFTPPAEVMRSDAAAQWDEISRPE